MDPDPLASFVFFVGLFFTVFFYVSYWVIRKAVRAALRDHQRELEAARFWDDETPPIA